MSRRVDREVYGKYQLLSRIASGGMAEVWLARSSSIGGFEKLLAIKRMHSRLGASETFISLFIEEAKLSVALNHPNIVHVFDFGEAGGDYYIAMEYVDGVDLSSLAARALDRGRTLPVAASVYIVRQVLEGLAYAHGNRKGRHAGIIHRDVSPHNVLVSFDGQVKLSDFGIAKALEEASRERTGEVVGKSAYVSPEQARGETLGAATDLWSAGVILHELLSGVRLFAKASDAETLDAVESQPIVPPSRANDEVPEALDRVTLALLERSPAKRPVSARAAVESLNEILRELWPRFDGYALAEVISELWDGELPAHSEPSSSHAAGLERTAPAGHDTHAEIRARAPEREAREAPLLETVSRLKVQFVDDPNLWTLFDIGRAYEAEGMKSRAIGAHKLAAAKFAQAGLLVEAMTILAHLRQIAGFGPRLQREVRRLPELKQMSDGDLLLEIFDPDDDTADFSEYHSLFAALKERPKESGVYASPAIFSQLDGAQLLRLFEALQLRHYPAGTKIVAEGGVGSSLFWIGRGRVVVSASNFEGRRVFLTSLTSGDYFGEHAFFTGEPRNADVEATEEVLAMEISKEAIEAVVREFPAVQDSLRHFYKERVAESLLARSSLFGHLSVRERRALAQHFTFAFCPEGSVILKEGDSSDAFYAIKEGRIEVFTGEGDSEVRLAELGPGQVFGEIAAVKGLPRTASVRATQDCELLRLEADTLKHFLAQNAEVASMIERQIEARAEETIQKLNT